MDAHNRQHGTVPGPGRWPARLLSGYFPVERLIDVDVVMLWFYKSGLVLLVGAEMNAELEKRRNEGDRAA